VRRCSNRLQIFGSSVPASSSTQHPASPQRAAQARLSSSPVPCPAHNQALRAHTAHQRKVVTSAPRATRGGRRGTLIFPAVERSMCGPGRSSTQPGALWRPEDTGTPLPAPLARPGAEPTGRTLFATSTRRAIRGHPLRDTATCTRSANNTLVQQYPAAAVAATLHRPQHPQHPQPGTRAHRGRDGAARGMRQCEECNAVKGEVKVDHRISRPPADSTSTLAPR
jgi:hypothetical protein